MGIRGRQYTPMDEPAFNKAIPGTEALAGTLKDTFSAFRSGLGITEPVVSVNCEGCGAPLPVIAKKSFDANTAIAKRSYSQHASITAGLAIA